MNTTKHLDSVLYLVETVPLHGIGLGITTLEGGGGDEGFNHCRRESRMRLRVIVFLLTRATSLLSMAACMHCRRKLSLFGLEACNDRGAPPCGMDNATVSLRLLMLRLARGMSVSTCRVNLLPRGGG